MYNVHACGVSAVSCIRAHCTHVMLIFYTPKTTLCSTNVECLYYMYCIVIYRVILQACKPVLFHFIHCSNSDFWNFQVHRNYIFSIIWIFTLFKERPMIIQTFVFQNNDFFENIDVPKLKFERVVSELFSSIM